MHSPLALISESTACRSSIRIPICIAARRFHEARDERLVGRNGRPDGSSVLLFMPSTIC